MGAAGEEEARGEESLLGVGWGRGAAVVGLSDVTSQVCGSGLWGWGRAARGAQAAPTPPNMCQRHSSPKAGERCRHNLGSQPTSTLTTVVAGGEEPSSPGYPILRVPQPLEHLPLRSQRSLFKCSLVGLGGSEGPALSQNQQLETVEGL